MTTKFKQVGHLLLKVFLFQFTSNIHRVEILATDVFEMLLKDAKQLCMLLFFGANASIIFILSLRGKYCQKCASHILLIYCTFLMCLCQM